MKKLLLVLAVSLAFFSVSAQNKHNIEKYTSQKPQYGFIENKGQIHDQNYMANPDVKYLLCLGNGMNVQLKANGFSYDTYKTEVKDNVINDSFDKMRPNNEPSKDITYYFHRVDVELVGANSNPEIVADEPSSDYLNYYNAVTPESGATFVRHYGKITYKEIYPGIDMVFVASAGEDKPVEYTFVVHPGADANQIKLHYIGANQTQLIDNKINIDVAHGSFTESIPASWIKETNDNLNITYKALDKDIYCFEIPSYAPTQTLIIDPNPNLDWGTYYGGSEFDKGCGISCDLNGNVFVTGNTYSVYWVMIATSGAHQEEIGGNDDAFVVKFNNNGVRQWGTFYGGSAYDRGEGIFCDLNGYVFVTGYTESATGIATSQVHQEAFGGTCDAFVVKFNNNGARQWGTYYGGSDGDLGSGIFCDAGGNIFITGVTTSTTEIATSGSHQETFGGNHDAFVVKFDNNGARQWGTYYGGSGYDGRCKIFCDTGGSVFLIGNTLSTTGIATSGSHQEIYSGGNSYGDTFVVKFDNNGAHQWGTYYGGSGDDEGNGIFCDAGGNVFITGFTSSTSGIASSGAHQETSLGSDAFVVKFNNDGVRQWGTYYGGNGEDWGTAISCNIIGNVYVTGYTGSTTGIATSEAHQEAIGGDMDAFVVKLNNDGVRQWGTYYGGSEWEEGCGIVCDGNENVLVTGYTMSTSGIATSGAHQETIAGGGYSSSFSAFIARFSSSYLVIEENVFSNIIVYPNPVSNELIIESKDNREIINFEIINSLGQIIFKGDLIEKTVVQTSVFAPGIYVIKLENGNTVEFKKIVKE